MWKKYKIKLRYSNSEIWTESTKDKTIAKLKDNGDIIKIKINDKKIELDYDEFLELLTIMEIKKSSDKQLNIGQSWS